MSTGEIQHERELFEQYIKQRAPGANLQKVGAEYVDLDVQWHFETWLARANMFQPASPAPCTNSDRAIDDTLVVQADPVAWLCLAQKGGMRDQRSLWIDERGADLWFDRMISLGCAVMKTPLYAAPPAQPDASVLVEALREARHLLALHSGEALPAYDAMQVIDRIDAALAGKGADQ